MTDACNVTSYGDFKPDSTELQAPDFYAPALTFTITGFRQDKSDKTKGILSFAETNLTYKTQKTNQVLMQEIFGPSPGDVIGKKITFFVTTDKFKGETVPALRVAGSPEMKESREVIVKYAAKAKRQSIRFNLRNTSNVPMYAKGGMVEPAEPPEPAPTQQHVDQVIAIIEIAPDLDKLKKTASDTSGQKPWTDAQKGEIRKAIARRKKELEKEAAPEVVPESEEMAEE